MRAVGILVALAVVFGILADVFFGGLNSGLGLVFYGLLIAALLRYIVVISRGPGEQS